MFEYKSIRDTAMIQKSDIRLGLTEAEAGKRLKKNGPNQLKEPAPKTIPETFFEQLNDPLIYVLLAAAAVSLFLHEVSDAVIIILVVLMNAIVGMIQEGKAKRALDSLKKLASPRAYVIRSGKETEIMAAELVNGDVVCLEAGRQVPADLRLLTTFGLKVEESALTGESVAQEKNAGFFPKGSRELPLGDRHNMAFMSTIVTSGRGTGMVTASGMDTEIGKIAALISESPKEITPLQRRLGDLGKMLSVLAVGLCVLLFLIAVIQKRDIFEMLVTAISLAVAAVPEGLPAVVTICLALSVTRMVKVNTIVRKLPAVETLGAVSVVCSDKTGTLTQNKMTVICCYMDEKIYERHQISLKQHKELLEGMALCNDAVLNKDTRIGDPTELALLDMAEEHGVDREKLEIQYPRVKELAFDSDRKMMSTYHKNGGDAVTYTKGAPEELLKKCSTILIQGKAVPVTPIHREHMERAMRDMSAEALRTLALAKRKGGTGPMEEKLTFIGMVGMKDPARPEAAEAVEKFRNAGVRTVMITGDHVDTAFAIASQLGIVSCPEECMTGEELQRLSEQEMKEAVERVGVFARVSPEHKVKIVKALKAGGNIVAMSGDGINDAPSLKTADVGIAMGMNGTDVARQASAIILTDDNFATIEKAMEEGRGVYENIKKSVIFLLSSNLGEILTMFLAVVCGLASPLKPGHILWINLITDSLPALALGVDKNDGNSMMQQPPRKLKESLFAGGGLTCTCFYGILIAAISLTAFFSIPYSVMRENGMSINPEHIMLLLKNNDLLMRAQTYAFTVLGMSQLFHAVGMRNIRKSVFRIKHWDNKLMIAACVVGFLLQFAVTKVPFLISAFGTVDLDVVDWLRLTLLASFPMIAHEIMAWLYNRG